MVLASTPASIARTAAMSADGSTIAIGSGGDNLLGVWRPAAGPLVPTCTAEARNSDEPNMLSSLSADGATIAIDWGPEARVLRRADGSPVSTIVHAGQKVFDLLTLSPDAQYLLAEFGSVGGAGPDFPIGVFRTSDGGQIADLGGEFAYQGGFWEGFLFPPNGHHLDGVLERNSPAFGQLLDFDLETGGSSSRLSGSGWAYLVGFSGDCPLMIDSNGSVMRSCGRCQPRQVATGSRNGLTSLDGRRYLSFDNNHQAASIGEYVFPTVLWDIGAQPAVVRTYPPRPEEASWSASEFPIAISAHGERVITTGDAYYSCANAPGFTSRVHDVATDAVIDELPPGITSTSAELKIVAFGPVLWCAH
jgi:hypothetical protein